MEPAAEINCPEAAAGQAGGDSAARTPKNPGGRPTLFDPAFNEIARKLCEAGAINEDLAAVFCVARSTINLWIQKHERFSGAVKAGRIIADAEIAAALYRRAIGFSFDVQRAVMDRDGKVHVITIQKYLHPDVRAMIFWLKNRQPHLWREKVTVAQTFAQEPQGAADRFREVFNRVADR